MAVAGRGQYHRLRASHRLDGQRPLAVAAAVGLGAEVAVAMGAGDGLGDRAQRGIASSRVAEAVRQDQDFQMTRLCTGA